MENQRFVISYTYNQLSFYCETEDPPIFIKDLLAISELELLGTIKIRKGYIQSANIE